MTDEQLRQLVRESIARHLGVPAPPVTSRPVVQVLQAPGWRAHPSHARFVVAIGRDEDGPCLVEPGVKCSHCGYCQSWGH